MWRSVIKWKSTQKVFDFFRTFLDICIPPSEEHEVVHTITTLAPYIDVSVRRGITTLLSFRDLEVRASIHEAKFHGNKKAQRLLGEVLAAYLAAIYGTELRIVCVPVPLSSQRLRTRGYNQVTQIIRAAMQHAQNVELCTNIIYRSRHTRPQTELNKKSRHANVRDVFRAYSTHPFARFFAYIHPSTIDANHTSRTLYILLDDVATTGATIGAARKTFEEYLETQKGQSVEIISIALAG